MTVAPRPNVRLPRLARPAAAAGLLAALMLGAILLLRLDDGFVNAYTGEDGIVEWVGAAFLLAAAVLMFLLFRHARASGVARLKTLSFLALALLFFVAAGEELSWGQRLLGVETPAALKEVNTQKEINIHNLYGGSGGQNLSSRGFQAFWITWGILIPVVAAASGRARRFIGRFIPILPVWFALLFAFQQALWKPVQANWREDPSAWGGLHRPSIGGAQPARIETREQAAASGQSGPAGLSEVMETNVQLLLFAGAIVLYQRRRTASRYTGVSSTFVQPEMRASKAS
jgi:hypothetical protein